MLRKLLCVFLLSFLVGCEYIYVGLGLIEPALNTLEAKNDVDVPIELGRNLSYETKFRAGRTTNYSIYLRTLFLKPNVSHFDLVEVVEKYPYDFTIKGYFIHPNGEKELVVNEHFTEKRETFSIYGVTPQYSKEILSFKLKKGNYLFVIQDNSKKMDFYSDIQASIKIAIDARIH